MREGFLYFNGESLELMQEPKEASFFFIEPGGNELKISSSEVNIRALFSIAHKADISVEHQFLWRYIQFIAFFTQSIHQIRLK